MQLKDNNENVNGGGLFQPGPEPGQYNQGPAGSYNQGPAGSYNQGPAAGPYNQGPAAGPYNQGPAAGPYNQGPAAGPYNQGPMAGSYNQGGMNGSYNSSFSDTVVKQKSGVPVWLIVIIVAAVVLILGVIIFDKAKALFGRADYIPGKLEGNTFTNEFFGFKVELDERWNITPYASNAETEKEDLEKRKMIVRELYAADTKSVALMDFEVKMLPYNFKATGQSLDSAMAGIEDEYVKTLEASGFTVDEIKKDKMDIAGNFCDGYIIKTTNSGTTVYIVQYYLIKDNYMAAFTTGAISEGKAKNIITNNVKKIGGN